MRAKGSIPKSASLGAVSKFGHRVEIPALTLHKASEMDDDRASKWERDWQAWWNRHALRSASEGGLFPDVVFRRYRDSVELSWGRAASEGMPVDFEFAESGPGIARLPPRNVAEPLHAVLSDSIEYLCSLSADCERFEALRRTLRALPRNPC